MVQKPKAIKLKVILGYILLLSFAVVSVWFVYSEILKIARPANTDNDNKKIIAISNTIASLYESEAMGRTSILTLSDKDHRAYNEALDDITDNLDSIQDNIVASQEIKFDSIQILLERKRKSTADIIQFRRQIGDANKFLKGISGINYAKDSIVDKVKPVKIEKKHEWTDLVNSLLTPRQMDSLSKLKVSNDSLAMAFDKVLTKLFLKDKNLQYELYLKEQNLLEENLVISDQLRALLSSVENEILRNSYEEIQNYQTGVRKTIDTMAWMGACALFILIIFAWIILSDITSSHNYRKQLEILNAENEQLLRSKTMLMATVTHDLQTPLGSIIGFSDLIDSSNVTDKQKQYVNNIKESADYILKLVNDLVDFSKLENNRILIEELSFNVKTLIENTCKTLEHVAENKNIELTWNTDDKLDNNFLSDPYRLKQVLINLISNSIKFTPAGSVEVSAVLRDRKIYIEVLDTGIGIATDKQQDVFKEFTQAHPDIEKRFGGTGLGLTISKKIIELLGGTIMLKSTEGEGSIFTVIMPAISCSQNEIKETKAPIHNVSTLLSGKKVLIIDDDPTQLTLLNEVFTGYGMVVKTESNSSNVASLIEHENFDIVLTDIQMPIVDGFDILGTIRRHKKRKISLLPVIALSGRKDLETKDYENAGFTAHHPKPVEISVLLDTIANIFDESVKIKAIQNKQQAEGKLYNLKSLNQFTHNDTNSLKIILTTFIGSSTNNCKELKHALASKNRDDISRIAHKMTPMLKQMEVFTIVKILDSLEDNTQNDNWEDLEVLITTVCTQITDLNERLTDEAG